MYKLAQTNEEELISDLETEMNNYGETKKEEDDDKNKAKEDESYVGYYADLDGEPTTAEGIIYADLACDKEGSVNDAIYKYSKETGKLKSYKIGAKIKSEKLNNYKKKLYY